MASKSPALSLLWLQHADSFFPSGAVSFSWGLETLFNAGLANNVSNLEQFLAAQLTGRWASVDRTVLLLAADAKENIDILDNLDWTIEALTLPTELRTGSQKMGSAILQVHKKLETPGTLEYLERIRRNKAFGHLSVVQGFVWNKLGFDAVQIELMSAHTLCTGILSAAVRLSVVGYIDAQRVYTRVQRLVTNIAANDILPLSDIHSFIPQTDIASMKHETDSIRLFVN